MPNLPVGIVAPFDPWIPGGDPIASFISLPYKVTVTYQDAHVDTLDGSVNSIPVNVLPLNPDGSLIGSPTTAIFDRTATNWIIIVEKTTSVPLLVEEWHFPDLDLIYPSGWAVLARVLPFDILYFQDV